MQTPVSIVIPAFNQLEYCRQCIESIQVNTTYPYRLILVDNGSTDGVSAYFDSVPGAIVVHSPENRGFAGGVNLGLAHAEGHVLLHNSDTIVPRFWLERMVDALESADDIGLVGPMSNCVSGSQLIDGLELNSLTAINAYAQDLWEKKGASARNVARLVGFCLLIRDRVFAELGTLDEGYGIGNFEDDDYCMKALRAGYRLCVAEGSFVFHYGSRTFMAMDITGEKWRALLDENEKTFQAKWNARPEERVDAAQESLQLNQQARNALENSDTRGAIRLLTEAIARFPWLDRNYNDLGVVLWQVGEQARAISLLRRAVALNPSNEDAAENLRQMEKTGTLNT
jgi:glycosyltransferase involved in cell wall biosynthesis